MNGDEWCVSAINGKEYIDRINKMKSEVWIAGKKVEGNISEHPAFSGIIRSQAKLYDLQHDPSKSNFMTFSSPTTGNKVGTSFLEPKTKEDLEMRRLMIQEWAKTSAGMMGRSPDYMNTALVAFNAAADIFSDSKLPFANHLRDVFELARENDFCFTHTFINPQVNRSQSFIENSTQVISAQTIGSNQDGIILKGARLLATQGGITDEILVFPAPGSVFNKDFAYAFSIPSNTPGLKFLCRESFSYKSSTFDHPLGSRFDENDTIVVFDDVLVPWDRVFCFQDTEASYKIYSESGFYPLAAHQVTARRIVKTEFILGTAQKLIETIKVGEYQHIQQKIIDILSALEIQKALLCTSEVNAKFDQWGTLVPDFNSLSTAVLLYTKMYPRFCEILKEIGASGLVSIPSEDDFVSEIGPDLDLYLQSAASSAKERVQLFRFAWDISMSAFGMRQSLYERYFFGDPIKMTTNLYHSYPRDRYLKLVDEFLQNQ
jgi:4-hydroxyphenylacetate 3-monooxygenase